MDASTLEVCEREHLIEEHIPRPQHVLRMDLSHCWISRVVALGAGFTCALLLAQALGPKVARGKTEGGGGQFLQEWKFEEVNVNSGDKVFDVLFNQTLYDCIEPVKHIADKRGRCYDTIFARQHKCYALRKEEPPASCKRTVKCLQGKKDEKPINPCEWLCTGGNRNQAWVKERCDKAAHDAMRWSGKCLDHGYEQRSFEAMEDVNVLSQRCVDETTSTTTQVGSHFFCWALVVPWTNEVDLLLMQQKLKKGIFECDGHEIYSDRSQRIYETIDKRSKKAQEMIARAAVEEVKNLTKDMQDVFEVQDIKGQIFKSLGEIDTPSLATIIASAFAPAQLRALHISNAISLMTVLVVVIIDALILVSDRGFTCQSFVGNKEGKRDAVDLWYKVDLGIAAFCVLVRLWTVRTLSPLIQEMNNPPMLEMQDDPVQALRALLAYYLNTGSRAIMRVDEITESLIYALSNWTVLFNLIWIGVAGDLVLNTPWSSCHDPGLIILRVRFILFLILIVPVLLNVVLFFAGRMLNGEGLQISLLNSASKADESLGIGVPLCSILVQAFFIRNKRDMINIQLKILQMKKEEAEKKRLEAEKELQRLQGDETSQDSQVETLQHQLQEEAGKDDNQVVKEQEEQREKVLQEAEQVFGLLNERAKKASGEAEAQVKKWEEGDGGELLQAISKGEGGAKLQEMLGKVDMQSMASQYAQQAQQMAGDLQNQEWVKDASQRAQAAVADAQQRGQELYNSEEVQGLMQGDQLQAAMQAGQEAASSAASAAQDAMSK